MTTIIITIIISVPIIIIIMMMMMMMMMIIIIIINNNDNDINSNFRYQECFSIRLSNHRTWSMIGRGKVIADLGYVVFFIGYFVIAFFTPPLLVT